MIRKNNSIADALNCVFIVDLSLMECLDHIAVLHCCFRKTAVHCSVVSVPCPLIPKALGKTAY